MTIKKEKQKSVQKCRKSKISLDDFRTSINFNNHNCQLKFTKIIHKRLGHKQFLDSELEANLS